jgi:hypothetical protein
MNLLGRLNRFVFAAVICTGTALTGCARHQELLPIRDPHLRKSGSEFAADAATRHPYPAEAPRAGEAHARAQVAYMLKRIEIANLSGQDWLGVELWVNRNYVVHLPVWEAGTLKKINFQMIYDDQGRHLPTSRTFVENVELLHNGQLYSVTTRVAD